MLRLPVALPSRSMFLIEDWVKGKCPCKYLSPFGEFGAANHTFVQLFAWRYWSIRVWHAFVFLNGAVTLEGLFWFVWTPVKVWSSAQNYRAEFQSFFNRRILTLGGLLLRILRVLTSLWCLFYRGYSTFLALQPFENQVLMQRFSSFNCFLLQRLLLNSLPRLLFPLVVFQFLQLAIVHPRFYVDCLFTVENDCCHEENCTRW